MGLDDVVKAASIPQAASYSSEAGDEGDEERQLGIQLMIQLKTFAISTST